MCVHHVCCSMCMPSHPSMPDIHFSPWGTRGETEAVKEDERGAWGLAGRDIGVWILMCTEPQRDGARPQARSLMSPTWPGPLLGQLPKAPPCPNKWPHWKMREQFCQSKGK